jgi:hypothetical protein
MTGVCWGTEAIFKASLPLPCVKNCASAAKDCASQGAALAALMWIAWELTYQLLSR